MKRTIAIERKGSAVVITIECVDDYTAIALYDEMTERMKEDGNLQLDFQGLAKADER